MLNICNLSIWFSSYTIGLRYQETRVIRDLDLSLQSGQVMAVIGQSGAGKSLLTGAILGILPRNARIKGRIYFKGELLDQGKLRRLRGREIALIPQSVTSLNPLLRIGVQIARAAQLGGIEKKEVKTTVHRTFERYNLQPTVADSFPFQLSGGMAHRALTATATVGTADLILADEPTSGLDPSTAHEALAHLRELADTGKAVLLITHDVEMALNIADLVAVFCEGTTVEVTDAKHFVGIDKLRHPYTRKLWNALPANGFLKSDISPLSFSGASGCPFHSSCEKKETICSERFPSLQATDQGWVRCHYA